MDLNLQVGDKITWEDKVIEIINDTDRLQEIEEYLQEEGYENILKIERPQYEEIYKKGVITHHITIETDKLKELILENHSNYMNVPLKTKAKIVSKYAEFDNDTDLLKFLEFMEE